jgi:hypothetical protein
MSQFNDFLKESGMYGGNHEALAESEARAFIHIKTLDEARNRRSAARQTGDVGIRQKEIRRDGNKKTGIKEDSESRPDEGGSFLPQQKEDHDIGKFERRRIKIRCSCMPVLLMRRKARSKNLLFKLLDNGRTQQKKHPMKNSNYVIFLPLTRS